MEFRSINKGYHRLEKSLNLDYIRAWEKGQTGIPLVDAAMRCLVTTGYLNFRMRALVVSFFVHQLWQPWQACSAFLARFSSARASRTASPIISETVASTMPQAIASHVPIRRQPASGTFAPRLSTPCPGLSGIMLVTPRRFRTQDSIVKGLTKVFFSKAFFFSTQMVEHGKLMV